MALVNCGFPKPVTRGRSTWVRAGIQGTRERQARGGAFKGRDSSGQTPSLRFAIVQGLRFESARARGRPQVAWAPAKIFPLPCPSVACMHFHY